MYAREKRWVVTNLDKRQNDGQSRKFVSRREKNDGGCPRDDEQIIDIRDEVLVAKMSPYIRINSSIPHCPRENDACVPTI